MTGILRHINVNPAGGVPKHSVARTRILVGGVAGDRQRNPKFHGGPTRAVCLFSVERIAELQAEGHPIAAGTTGENLTVEGLDWVSITPGVRLRVGAEVVLEITSFTVPCRNIAGSFCDGDSTRIGQQAHPGWSRVYAKVIVEGEVAVGDAVVAEPADGALFGW
jgi:MOSC domain-containing protein YiiM